MIYLIFYTANDINRSSLDAQVTYEKVQITSPKWQFFQVTYCRLISIINHITACRKANFFWKRARSLSQRKTVPSFSPMLSKDQLLSSLFVHYQK